MKRALAEVPRQDVMVAVLFFIATAVMAAVATVRPVASLWLYAGLFLPYAFFIHRSLSARSLNPALVVALALAVRFALAFAEPVLSDDIYRYVWEGRVSLAAHNPFYLAPDSEVLVNLRDSAIWPNINHREIPTIYPPMAQFAFAFNALWNGGTTSMRLIFIAVEILTVFIVWRWTRGEGDAWKVPALTLYALNPLVFVETAWSGHLDVIAWSALILALCVWQKGDSAAHGAHAGLWLGMSIAAKFLGLMALAAIVLTPTRDWATESKKRGALLATVFLIVGASYLPYIEAGPSLFQGFGSYAASWRSNDGGFRLVSDTTEAAIESWAPESWRQDPADPSTTLVKLDKLDPLFLRLGITKEWEGRTLAATTFAPTQIAQSAAKLLALLVMFLALLWCVIVEPDPFRKFAVLMMTLLFVAPTVHPWYVAWLIPFAALRPRAAPLVFSALCLVAYGAWVSTIRGGAWELPAWVIAIEYLTVLAVIILGSGRPTAYGAPPMRLSSSNASTEDSDANELAAS